MTTSSDRVGVGNPVTVTAALAAALPEYEPVDEPARMARGYGSEAWRVPTTAGTVLVKIAIRWPDGARVPNAAEGARLAAAANVMTPQALAGPTTWPAFEDRAYSVWEFLDGRDASDALETMDERAIQVFFARLGAAIAQLHSVRGSAYARSTLATDRHANWSQAIDSRLAQTADRYAAAGLELDALTTRACTRIAALATQVSTISTPTFVHSDLYLDNLLLGSGDVPVVLDFEHCGYADACVEFVKPTLFVFDGVPGARDALIDAYVAASHTDALDERLDVALGMELVWGLPFFEQWGDVAVADLYRSRLARWLDAP